MIVYKSINKTNKKIYIGITTRSLNRRIYEHLFNAKNNSQTKFHRAIRKYGSDNFEWSIIYKGESLEEIFKKEIFFIQKFNSYKNGYNMTIGGDSGFGFKGEEHPNSSINEETAKKIIHLITHTDLKYREISEITDTPKSTVLHVAFGNSWSHLYDEAPFKNRPETALKLNKIDLDMAKDIVCMLENTNFNQLEISKILNVTRGNVQNIAMGKAWKELYDEPIYKNRPIKSRVRNKISEDEAKLIVKYITETFEPYSEIAKRLNVTLSAVRHIGAGERWCHLYNEPPGITRKNKRKRGK